MASDANPTPGGSDEARFTEISAALADRIDSVLPGWIEHLVLVRVEQWRGRIDPTVAEAAVAAGERAQREVMPEVRALLATDIDAQRANPLAVLRGATRFAHDVLDALGLPEVQRDDFARRSFPDDTYDLVPAAWDEIDPTLHEIGITWGAAKAFVYKARRRSAGQI